MTEDKVLERFKDDFLKVRRLRDEWVRLDELIPEHGEPPSFQEVSKALAEFEDAAADLVLFMIQDIPEWFEERPECTQTV